MGHPVSGDDDDSFEVSGPTHMRSNGASKIVIDWDNPEERRCAMACLVKGTYVMENEASKRRIYDDQLGPAWWETFGFRMVKPFINDTHPYDQYSYGAIFSLDAPYPRHPSTPEFVVVFRGTMLWHPKFMDELLQDFWVLFNAVTDYTRFKRINPVVHKVISSSDSVWLAGHSLGASMALEMGRKLMLEKGRNVPTFLFNPPHVSPAPVIHDLLAEENKTRLYTVSFMFKYALANMFPGYHQHTKQLFQQLAPWVPELYVNHGDTICRGYIDYFVERQLVYEEHPRFAKTAGRASYRDMFVCMFTDKVQPHLLPSARLWANSTCKEDAHDLRQWWKSNSDLALTTTQYGYDPRNGALSAWP
ncbi:hypothetical protein ACQ4PT_051030 [Festuca glaucescens]